MSRRFRAEAALAAACLFWGSTFVVIKELVREVPANTLLVYRFLPAAAVLFLIDRARRRRRPSVAETGSGARFWGAAGTLGGVLYLCYAGMTEGLVTTSASKSAIIISAYVIWVPVLMAIRPGGRFRAATFAAAGAGVIGIALLATGGGGGGSLAAPPVVGDALTLGASFAFALQILWTTRHSRNYPPLRLAAAELLVVAVISLAVALVSGGPAALAVPPPALPWLAYLALFPTALAYWTQTALQRDTSEERAAVIYLSEPVFALLLAAAVLGERLATLQWAGAAAVLAVILAQALGKRPGTPGV